MRLAGEYERAEGRDLRGFLADAQARDLAEAREGEAALESEGLDAVRLMTIHRAKGLEFPVVCVADLGRKAGGAARRCWSATTAPPASGSPRSAAATRSRPPPGSELAARGQRRRRRGGAPPVLRRDDPREGAADPLGRHRRRQVADRHAPAARRSTGSPARSSACPRPSSPAPPRRPRVARRRTPRGLAARGLVAPAPATPCPAPSSSPASGTAARRGSSQSSTRPPRSAPSCPSGRSSRGPAHAPTAPTTALPAKPAYVPPRSARARPAPQRLSYSQLSDYAKCGYRFYLKRVLRLPDVTPPPPEVEPEVVVAGIDPRTRGSIVHQALEELDFDAPAAPDDDVIRAFADDEGVTLTDERARGHPGIRAGVRGLTAVRAADPRRRRHARGVVRVRARARRLRPARARLRRRLRPRGRRHPPRRRLQDRPRPAGRAPRTSTSPATTRRSGSSTRSPRYERARPRSRSRTACSSARTSRSRRSTPPRTPPTSRTRSAKLADGVLTHHYAVTETPHRELCGACPGRHALCSHPQSLTLRPPPAPWPGTPARRTSPAGTSPA